MTLLLAQNSCKPRTPCISTFPLETLTSHIICVGKLCGTVQQKFYKNLQLEICLVGRIIIFCTIIRFSHMTCSVFSQFTNNCLFECLRHPKLAPVDKTRGIGRSKKDPIFLYKQTFAQTFVQMSEQTLI